MSDIHFPSERKLKSDWGYKYFRSDLYNFLDGDLCFHKKDHSPDTPRAWNCNNSGHTFGAQSGGEGLGVGGHGIARTCGTTPT